MPATVVTGVFPDTNSALKAGERAREVAGPRATIRVMVPGPNGRVIETSVLADKSSYWELPLLGLGLGVAMAVGLVLYGASIGYVLFAFIASLGTGAMIGVWLSGEVHPRKIFSATAGSYQRSLQGILAAQSVVSAVLKDPAHAADVATAFRDSGGTVTQGYLHQLSGSVAPPLATT